MNALLVRLPYFFVLFAMLVFSCEVRATDLLLIAPGAPKIVKVETDHGGSPGDVSTDEIYLEYSDGTRKFLTKNKLMERVPTFSANNQFVSFLRRRDTNNDGDVSWADDVELCVFDLRTSATRVLSTGMFDVGMPTWHPRDLTIAFTASKKLYTLDLLTNKRRKIIDNVGDWPTWSSDGTLIAFYDVQNRVNIVKTDGTQRRTLTDDVGNGWALYWMTDNRLLFAHEKKGLQVFSPVDQSIKALKKISEIETEKIIDQQQFNWSSSTLVPPAGDPRSKRRSCKSKSP